MVVSRGRQAFFCDTAWRGVCHFLGDFSIQDRCKTVVLFLVGAVLFRMDRLTVNRAAIGAPVRVAMHGGVLTRQAEGGSGEENQAI